MQDRMRGRTRTDEYTSEAANCREKAAWGLVTTFGDTGKDGGGVCCCKWRVADTTYFLFFPETSM
jgi:hypothetical protein